MSFNKTKYTPKELQRMKDFITPDLRPSYLLFKDKNDHPEAYAHTSVALQEGEDVRRIEKRPGIVKFLEQYRAKIVKDTRVKD